MRRAAIVLWMLSAACGSDPVLSGEKQTAVMQTMLLGREEPEGIAPGFNLDGVRSDSRDSRSCGKKDFIDAAGREGIDNQLATFVPLLDLTGEGAVEGLVQTAINEGRLLVVFDVETFADGQAKARAYRGLDTPLLGTNNLLLEGQTLAINEADPLLGVAEQGVVEGSTILIGPFDVRFPIIVFELLYEIHLTGAYVRFDLDDTGRISGGVLGGAAAITQLFTLLETASLRAGADYVALIGPGLRDAADLAREGPECTKMSMAVTFSAVPAFMY